MAVAARGSSSAVKKLMLASFGSGLEEQMDLEVELANFGATVDMSALEKDFIKVARTYSERQGISYTAWRKVGVEPRVLKAAGIKRGKRCWAATGAPCGALSRGLAACRAKGRRP